jgi:two-component system, LytTR family, sensor kinase
MQSTENKEMYRAESSPRTRAGLRYPGWLALFIIWTVVGAFGYIRHRLDPGSPPSGRSPLVEFAGWLTCFYPWILLGPLVFYVERRHPLNRAKWLTSSPVLALYGILLAFVAVKITLALNVPLDSRISLRTVLLSVPSYEFWLALFLYWNIAIAGAVIRTIMGLERQKRVAAELALENAKLETCLKNAELEALRLRLKPHFLFNTLENISALAEDNPRLARKMLSRLGELLRAAFRRDFQAEISLSSEIALMNAYIDVERVRFGEQLKVDVEIDPETEAALVPSLLLQPLVENAIVHGLRHVSDAGRIEVRSSKTSDALVLTVKDNGCGPNQTMEELSLGVGLGSTRERLSRMYPRNHQLSVKRSDDGGTLVHISLPFRTKIA